MPPGRHVWIVPALNLDGLAAGTKNNANDVDLNRNFAAANWEQDHKPGYSPGPEPESEPETRALVDLIERYEATADMGYPTPGSFGSKYGVDRGLEIVTLEIPPMQEDRAWQENRAALRLAVDLPT